MNGTLHKANTCNAFLPPVFDSVELIVFLALNIITGIVACFGNSLVIAAIFFYPLLRSRTNLFLFVLAISDFLLAVCVQTLACVTVLIPQDEDEKCMYSTVLMYLSHGLCGTSGYMLALISYDRYQHISKLNNYHQHMSPRKVKLLVTLCWILPSTFGAFVFSQHTAAISYIMAVVSLVATMGIVSFCYMKSWKIVRSHLLERINDSSRVVCRKKSKALKEYWKIAKSLSILVFVYIILLTPLTLFSIVEEYFTYVHNYDIGQKTYTSKILYFSLLFVYCNASINPFLYYSKTRELKDGMNAIGFTIVYCQKQPLITNQRASLGNINGEDNISYNELSERRKSINPL